MNNGQRKDGSRQQSNSVITRSLNLLPSLIITLAARHPPAQLLRPEHGSLLLPLLYAFFSGPYLVMLSTCITYECDRTWLKLLLK